MANLIKRSLVGATCLLFGFSSMTLLAAGTSGTTSGGNSAATFGIVAGVAGLGGGVGPDAGKKGDGEGSGSDKKAKAGSATGVGSVKYDNGLVRYAYKISANGDVNLTIFKGKANLGWGRDQQPGVMQVKTMVVKDIKMSHPEVKDPRIVQTIIK